MDILNVLKQLRDDIKTWVTNNINALNTKIDEKTIPIDNELSSTSTNPVQNQAIAKEIDSINDRVGDTPVATQISQAINAQEHFSGDYNDLTNAPDITDDGADNMVITDESGNIIFKADADGIHTTAVSLNGEAAATEKYVDEAIANIDIPEVDFTGYATEDFVASAVESAKEELSESITAEAEDWKVVDESGNIIFSVDAEGAHTTNLTLSDGKAATETYVDNAIAAIDFPETDLTGYATEKYVDEAIAAIPETDLSDYYTKEQTNAAINTAKEELSESIVAESDEWKVVDEAGNVIFSVDATGAHTTELTLNGESAATESYVDDAIANIEFPTTDLTDYATKKYVDDAVDGIKIPEVDFTGYATETYVDNKVADLVNSAPEALDTLGELAVALEVHEDAYDALLETVGSKATHTDLENLKEELSESIVAETDEWKVVDENGNIIFSVDASGAHTTELTLNGQSVEDMIDDKVDKVDGKGLSTNDFTNIEKDKLAGIEASAEKNVQPNWNQNDENASDYVKNRTHYESTILGPSTLSIEDSAEEFTGDSNDYHIYCSMPDEYKYAYDHNNYYVEFWMSKLNTKLDVHSELNVLGISGETYYLESSSTTEIRKVQGKNYTLYYARDDWQSEPDEEGATSAITRISDGVIIAADEPCPVSIRCGYSNPAGYWEGFVEINIPSAGIWISRGITVTLEPTVKYVCHKLDEKYIPDTIAKVVDIKNGTYFTEAEKYDILVDTTTINVEAEDFYYRTTQSPFTAQIIDGNKYLVIFDEVSYICYGRKYNKMNDTLSNSFDYCLIGDVVFNNGNYSRPISGSNLPFCIVNDYFENTNDFTADVLVFGDTASTHTIKIVDVTPTVKKLPEEFLADNFKAVTKGFGEKSAIFGLGQEASGEMSIAAGQSTVASGWMSIALGLASKASGAAALTLGQLAEASGTLAVAHGFNTKASGAAAVAAGDGTIAGSECQLVHGKFNIEDTADTYAHIVGNGTDNGNRSNAHTLDWEGNAWFAGEVSANSIKIGNTIFTETQLLKILNFIETVEIGNN